MSERAEALKELGRRLAACRRQAGLELEELSERSGVALRQLMDFERGQGGLGSGGLVRLAQGPPGSTGPAGLRGAWLGQGSHAPRAKEAACSLGLGNAVAAYRRTLGRALGGRRAWEWSGARERGRYAA